jgi:hypothetical protein
MSLLHILTFIFVVSHCKSFLNKESSPNSTPPRHIENKNILIPNIENKEILDPNLNEAKKSVSQKTDHFLPLDIDEGLSALTKEELNFLKEQAKSEKPPEFGLTQQDEEVLISTLTIGLGTLIGAGAYKFRQHIGQGLLVAGVNHPKLKVWNYKNKQLVNLKKLQKTPEYGYTKMELSGEVTTLNLKKLKIDGRSDSIDVKVEAAPGEGTVVLGILPTKGQLRTLTKDGKKVSVLSVVEDFELSTPVSLAGLKKPGEAVRDIRKDIDHESSGHFVGKKQMEEIQGEWKKIESPDYRPVPGDKLDQAADWIHKRIQAGDIVYIHCKSGKGRSASAYAAYLMKYKGLSPLEAVAWIKNQRSFVSIGKDKGHMNALAKFGERLGYTKRPGDNILPSGRPPPRPVATE